MADWGSNPGHVDASPAPCPLDHAHETAAQGVCPKGNPICPSMWCQPTWVLSIFPTYSDKNAPSPFYTVDHHEKNHKTPKWW